MGDCRTSARECRWPEEEWTTTMFWRRGFKVGVVVFATDWMCFWNPAAVKPGEARRMGFVDGSFWGLLELELELELAPVAVDEPVALLNSIWRRRVSSVSW